MTVGWPHVGWRRPFNSYTIVRISLPFGDGRRDGAIDFHTATHVIV